MAAGSGYERLRGTILRLREVLGGEADADMEKVKRNEETGAIWEKFADAMNDDFNTPVAIGHLFEGVSNANKLLASGGADRPLLESYNALFTVAFENVLGLVFPADQAKGGALTDDLMRLIIDLRAGARQNKDFATADRIRDGLKEAGVVLEDGKEGTRWGVE